MPRHFALAALLTSARAASCDIYASAGTPCVAAFSLIRALYSNFAGPLYEVTRASDNSTLNVSVSSPGSFVDVAPQLAFCNASSTPPALPPLGTVLRLRPRAPAADLLSFRHCDAQGFISPDDGEDHLFTLVAPLNGAGGAVSFRSVNFPAYYIAPVLGAPEPLRLGVAEAPPPGDASWTLSPAPGAGAFTLTLAARGGLAMAVASALTGSCAANYAPPSASVVLAAAGTQWTLEPAAVAAACTISRIWDQSPMGNHLATAPPGGAANHPDSPVDAMAFPVSLAGGRRAFGARFEGRMGYRRDDTLGVATGNAPETIVSVLAGGVYNDGCCALLAPVLPRRAARAPLRPARSRTAPPPHLTPTHTHTPTHTPLPSSPRKAWTSETRR